VARYNVTVRYDWLTHHLFETIAAVKARASNWLWTHNNQRLNIAIGGIMPKQKLPMAA
jgi:putative transposase